MRPLLVPTERRLVGLVPVGVGALALAPLLLHRGFALIGDMAFVPHQPWKPEWLGLDDATPRAVPADAVVTLLTTVVPGDLVQKALLLGAFVLAGHGVLRLLAARSTGSQVGGVLLYLWNPWVLERLAIGHWGLVLGWAALPWVAATAPGVRRAGTRGLAALVPWLALAAVGSPTGGLIAAATAIVLVAPAPRRIAQVSAAALLVNLPWILPSLLHSAATSDPAGVKAFAASADSPWGVLGSLLSLGGIWKQSIVPADRASLLLSGLALLVSLAGLVAVRRQPRLLGLGLAALVVAWLPATAPGAAVTTWLVGHVPGAGLLRDSQKWVLPLVLVAAVGFALVLEHLATRVHPGVAVALALLPVVALPSLAWGLGGLLEPVRFPAEWSQVATQLDRAGTSRDRVVVLPWAAYRRFDWNGTRASLDPAIRFFPGQVLTSEDLVVGPGREVAGERSLSRRVGRVVERGGPVAPGLHRLGVRWIVVEKGPRPGSDLTGATVVHDGRELRVLDLGATRAPRLSSYAWLVVAGDVLALLTLLLALTVLVRRSMHVRSV